MNLLYVSLSYIPSRRASSVHVMRMCAALSRAAHDVELVVKRSREPSNSTLDDFAFYGVAPTFGIAKLARPSWRGGGLVFAGGIARKLLERRASIDLVYSRELIGALLAAELRIPVIFESHGIPEERFNRVAMRRLASHPMLRGIVVISDALRRDLIAHDMAPHHRPIVIAHDAADPPGAIESRSETSARRRIGYVGSLYSGRGIELILELAPRIPECDVELVGGTETDLAKWRARGLPPNVKLVGFVPPGQLHELYQSFDVLLMPYPRAGVAVASGGDTSRWASPMKMFEYMAAGAPIIASDLPVLGEVLEHERNALIAPADDVAAWQQAVRRLCADRTFARTLAGRAYDDLVANYTWDARVRKIFAGL